MALKPIGKAFLFAFFNETYGGQFVERNKGSLILTNQDLDTQMKYARWAKVLAAGNTVTDFKNGDIVLIEPGMWTTGFTHEGVKVWKSDESKVIAIGEDESVTYTY